MFSFIAPSHLISTYGYWAIAAIIGLEGIGIPLPGETTLVLAAAYAGSTHKLEIGMVIVAAAAGSMVGSIIGFWIGREIGYRILLRYGPYVRLTEEKIKIGQYLFLRHGGKIVFVARFVPVLRMIAGLLAGANRMPWPYFLLFNSAGSILWACVFGLVAYYFGQEADRLARPVEIAMGAFMVVLFFAGWLLLRRREAQLAEAAERALPGPLRVPGRRRALRG